MFELNGALPLAGYCCSSAMIRVFAGVRVTPTVREESICKALAVRLRAHFFFPALKLTVAGTCHFFHLKIWFSVVSFK
ncbi:hypothetical protein [Raoultella ornithinolytica]|uniref:hypothetical protein n=1 Tax=Raoultella ornithinolytica TaxID=54291 RepID=UPI0015DC80CE|nr:hypothetical protein [Raoultella ornithinolytica]QLK21660.1 hypothetical protein GPJ66_13110 [Raoultella ornithinolytica]HAU5004931.1 hypothetical protein [Raoultella ornithinolytica]